MPDSFKPELLIELVTKTIPYGKYQGTLYYQLPINYLEWFNRKGFPQGKVGLLLATLYEIKLNGLEFLLLEIQKSHKAN